MANQLCVRLKNDFVAHDRSQLMWRSGLRNAFGIVLPLAVGLVSNTVPASVVVAIRAVVTGFAGLSGPWQKRVRVMWWAIVWVTLSAFLGVSVDRTSWLVLLLIMFSGGLAGLFVSVSPEMAQIGTLATNAAIIFSGMPLKPSDAVGIAANVFLGGSLQLVLVLVLVPWELPADGMQSLKNVLMERSPETQRRETRLMRTHAAGLVGQIPDCH